MKNKVLMFGMLLGIFVLVLSSAPVVRSEGAPRRIEVTAKRFSFEPAEITLKKGDPVLLVVKSMDVSHGVRFRELNVNINVRGGGTAQAQFTPSTAGDFVGHCSVFCGSGHGSMALKLHVVD